MATSANWKTSPDTSERTSRPPILPKTLALSEMSLTYTARRDQSLMVLSKPGRVKKSPITSWLRCADASQSGKCGVNVQQTQSGRTIMPGAAVTP